MRLIGRVRRPSAVLGLGRRKSLQDFLLKLPPGPIGEIGELPALLAKAWESLIGTKSGGMRAEKLLGRIDSVAWNPPRLEFTIERHGATVEGSTRANLQNWVVDVERGTADLRGSGTRQVRRSQPRLDIAILVVEISASVLAGGVSKALKWSPDRARCRRSGADS